MEYINSEAILMIKYFKVLLTISLTSSEVVLKAKN